MGQIIAAYDSDQIAIIFGAIKVDSGFAEDSMLKVEPDDDYFKDVIGVDGSVTRSKTKNKAAKATVFLMQSSPINDLFSAIMILDQNAPNGAGVGAFLVKDLNGTTLCSAPHSWIQRPPDQEWARTAKERQWLIRLADATIFVGSNPKL